jgi:hypothetical protein
MIVRVKRSLFSAMTFVGEPGGAIVGAGSGANEIEVEVEGRGDVVDLVERIEAREDLLPRLEMERWWDFGKLSLVGVGSRDVPVAPRGTAAGCRSVIWEIETDRPLSILPRDDG